jgi:hypothetical protein
LLLRQARIAVIIVHHTNRKGNDMRGTSRREDAADWVVKVSPNFEFAKIDKGTAFPTTFLRNREDDGSMKNLWTGHLSQGVPQGSSFDESEGPLFEVQHILRSADCETLDAVFQQWMIRLQKDIDANGEDVEWCLN